LSNFEQAGAILSNFFGPAWVISSNFEHFCRASWSCRAILNIFWKHDMALSTLDNVQNVSIEAALRHLAEKGG